MSEPETLALARQTLEGLRKSQLKIELTAGILTLTAALLVIWLLGAIMEAAFRFSPPGRIWLLVTLIVLPTIGFIAAGLKLRRDPRLRPGRAAEEFWALKLGRTARDKLRDRLLNALQLTQSSPSHRDNYSGDLARQALYLAVADMKDIPLGSALNRKPSVASARVLAVVAAAAVAVAASAPGSLSSAANRLLHPTSSFDVPPEFKLAVEPAGGWAYRGELVEFVIRALGKTPVEVEFITQYAGGQPQDQRVLLKNGEGKLRAEGFSSDITYLARRGAVASPEYSLEIVSRPQIVELQYRLTPPHYSRLPEVLGPDNVGDLEGLPGSRVSLNLRASKALKEAWMMRLDAGSGELIRDSVAFAVSGKEAQLDFNLAQELRYRIQLKDSDGHPNRDPVTYSVKLIADQPPSVAIRFPEGDVDMGDDTRLPLQIEAFDDYGISRVELAYRLMQQDTTLSTLPLNATGSGEGTVEVNQVWDLGSLALMPGDVVEYWAVAFDNDNVRGPKRGESQRRLLRLPSVEEIIAGVQQSEDAGLDQAQRTLEAAQEAKEQVSKLIEEMKRNPEVDWQRQKQIESAMQQQDQLQQQAQDLSKKLDDLVNRLEKHDLTTQETLEKYQELQKLISEIATPELKAAMDKLRQAMQSQDPEQLRQAMEQFNLNREQFLESIERTLNILKQLQLERKLDELAKRTEELLHRQEEILDQMKEGKSAELASRQSALADQTDQLLNDLKQTAQMAQEAQEAELAADLDSLAAAFDSTNLSQGMREGANALSRNQSSQAKVRGEESARGLSELASSLSKLSNDFKESQKAALEGKVRRLAEELIYISSAEEKLMDRGAQIGTQSPQYRDLAGDQQDIRSAMQGVIDRIFELSKETFFVTPDLGADLGKGAGELDRALEGYSNRSPRSVSTPQKNALGAINRSAQQLLTVMSQLQGSSSASGFEEMMKQLSEMAGSQQGLNQQTMPMFGSEGQGMMPGAGDKLSQLAAQQRALQEQMQKASEGAQGMQEILGDLGQIAAQMGEVAKDLEDKNLGERTRRLQQQIVNRLLDATRSAREEEYSRQRESKSGEQMARRSPPPLMQELEQQRISRDLQKALQEGYTRDYRELIRQYFQALEQTGK